MLQDPSCKPPNEIGLNSSFRATTDRRQKTNAQSEEVLNCPRCDSMNTKFCYYNNYSLSQPRHFCKNCRRYWTKGGALRNVPIGGGCRKNKRVKHRSVDANSLGALDETTSNMLASMSSTNCSSFLPNFAGPSTCGYTDLSNESQRYGLPFSHIQETLRIGEQSGAIPSHPPGVYELGTGSSQVTADLLKGSCSQPPLMRSLPSFDTNLMSVSYPGCYVKHEQGVLYTGSDLNSLFVENSGHTAGTATTTNLTSLEDQLSTYNMSMESFNGSGIETQLRNPHQKLAMQLLNEVRSGEQGHMFPAFDGETEESLRRLKGKSMQLHSAGDGRPIPDWQGAPSEAYLETAGDSNFWSSTGWPDFHALAGSTVGATL